MVSPLKTGVLLIAHGSGAEEWNWLVEEAALAVETEFPLKVGYLELVEGQLIPDGVRELEAMGVERILAVPLFVSSGSTHLEEIRYALGVEHRPRIKTALPQIWPRAEILWCPAMDAHPCVRGIMADRVRALADSSLEETLLLAAHGSEKSGFREEWEKGLASLAEEMGQRFGFAAVDYAMLRTGDLRLKAEALARRGRLLVMPTFLSRGYFTETVLPRELEGIPHRYRGETYLPHPGVSRWVEDTIKRALSTR
ncbi:sirohydrochlorin chelatase [Salinithrix halophila]|uniref:Sirohydrochlorin chelatase n=1 Tax=Salinithrix halophila TaxID=1485204 RepID=A0ABV8JAI2_9BACL